MKAKILTLPKMFQWAGGKSKMLTHYQPFLPKVVDSYVEPFAGGAALFGHMCASGVKPARSLLGDTNLELMDLYRFVRDDPSGFISRVAVYDALWSGLSPEARRSTYYDWRMQYWGMSLGLDATALLYTLMRTSFNGIWQTCIDSKGRFGTPVGLVDKKGGFLKEDTVWAWSDALNGVVLHSGSFEGVDVPEGSFVYCDPPYRDSFTHYSTGFDDAYQTSLVMWCQRQHKERHANVWLANREADDGFFEHLAPDAKFHRFPVTYTAGRRKKTAEGYEAKPATELLLTWG